jgi:G:T-mismatch repair DNA endonuclease (very short patch repair protein)
MPEPIISMRYEQADDGGWRVIAVISGLRDELQANAAIDHLQATLCGSEAQLIDEQKGGDGNG